MVAGIQIAMNQSVKIDWRLVQETIDVEMYS